MTQVEKDKTENKKSIVEIVYDENDKRKKNFKSNIKTEERKRKLLSFKNNLIQSIASFPLTLAKLLDVLFNFFTIFAICISIVLGIYAIYNGKYLMVICVSLFIYVVSIINDKISM